MKFPNKYLRNLKPYKLASHLIWSVNPNERETILKLDWNEATIPPSPKVKEAILQLLEEPNFFNLYPTTHDSELLEALSNYVSLPQENVQYFGSSDALHEYICKVFVSVGDPVMILGPSYDNFRLTCQANGGNVVYSNYTDNFEFDAEHFEKDIQSLEPALVYICNPNNPTGNIHSIDYIEYLLMTFPDTLFLIDEAYYEFSGITAKDLVLRYDNILISRTMSKAFALANFRVGYLLASRDNVSFINKIRNPKNLSTFAQKAALAALNDTDYMWRYVDQVRENKQFFLHALSQECPDIRFFAGHGNFSLFQFRTAKEKMGCVAWLTEHKVFVRELTQGEMVERCIRITIGTRGQMERVLGVLNSFYHQ